MAFSRIRLAANLNMKLANLMLTICLTTTLFLLFLFHRGPEAGRNCLESIAPVPSVNTTKHNQHIRWDLKSIPDRARVVRSLSAPSFWVSLGTTNDFIAEHIWGGRTWEPWVTGNMLTVLNKLKPESGSLVIDVGANIGYFGLAACAMGWRTHGIEALPLNADLVRMSILINSFTDRYTLHVVSAGAKSSKPGEELCVCEPHGNPTDGILVPMDSISSHEYCKDLLKETGCKIKVSVETVDNLIPQDIPVAFLKIDVEGFEFFVLQGASRVLDSQRPCGILLELNPTLMFANGYTSQNISTLLLDKGYWPNICEKAQVQADGFIEFHEKGNLDNCMWAPTIKPAHC
jgi:FkbM family methyltransferase